MKFQVFHVNPGEKLKKKMLIMILAILCQSFLVQVYWHLVYIIMMRNLPILFIHRKWAAPIVVKVQQGGRKINVNKRLNHLNFILKESSLYLPNLPIPSWYYYSKSNKLIDPSFQSTMGHFELKVCKGSLNTYCCD